MTVENTATASRMRLRRFQRFRCGSKKIWRFMPEESLQEVPGRGQERHFQTGPRSCGSLGLAPNNAGAESLDALPAHSSQRRPLLLVKTLLQLRKASWLPGMTKGRAVLA